MRTPISERREDTPRISPDDKGERASICGENLREFSRKSQKSNKEIARLLGISLKQYQDVSLKGRYCPGSYLLSDMATFFDTHPCRILLSQSEFRNMMTDIIERRRINPIGHRFVEPLWDARFLHFIPREMRRLRLANKLTLQQASLRATIQLSTWHRYEKTGSLPQTRLWPAIAAALETTPLELTTPPDRIIPVVQRLLQDNGIPFS